MIPINFAYPRSGNVEQFDYYASLSIAPGVTSDVFRQVVSSNFKRGFITAFGHGIDDPTAFLLSVFSIRVNDVADRYYQNIQDQLAPFSEPREIAPILVRPGDVLSVRVTNNNVASKLYAARIRGFFDFAYLEKM
jgi:hypothetical protein